jgi:uncharacterized phage protein (TIGR01671 family)
MKTYKFRVWDKLTKRMIYLNGVHDTFTFRGNGNVEYYNLQNGSGGDEYDIMQHIGLEDENGKKLYEKDIIKKWGDIKCIEDILMAGYMIYECTLMDGDFEIIGNKFETPELMNENN